MSKPQHQDLENTIQNFAREAGGLGVQLADIAQSVHGVNTQVSDQADRLIDFQRGMQELSGNNHRIMDTVTSMAEAADTASNQVHASRKQFNEAMRVINELVGRVDETKDLLDAFQKALRTVAKVTDSIKSIADMTNVLALNAAIEAARAGQAGARFAVVAHEVKSLATQTSSSTQEIGTTLEALFVTAEKLLENGSKSVEQAHAVKDQSENLEETIGALEDVMGGVYKQSKHITGEADGINQQCSCLNESLGMATSGITQSAELLSDADRQVKGLLDSGEKLMRLTQESGVETDDTRFIAVIQERAAQIGKIFENAIANGRITQQELFDTDYQPIPNTNPQQHLVPCVAITDSELPPLQEAMLDFDEKVAFCAAVDKNGFLPTHNNKFSHPQNPDDPDWNAGNCRNRRIFDDRTGLAAGRNTKNFLLQTYKRDMGGGNFVLMKDLSAPIYVHGKHWGGLRLGYRV
ncbi:methyl-accepting chemotaxis protein [Magnetococcus sp. PR-3]|uniref:methyl-accepting chemotaxis protein n=1 Tax=Magnetococcus sp. PR-3 TaxID=3120355 RepID=UPI002FCDF2A4